MRPTMFTRFALALFALAFLAMPVRAQITPADAALKTNQFDYEYVEPTNPQHRALYDMVREKRILENFQEFFSPIRLPRRITLKIEGCDGNANAQFWRGAITVCYEYFEYIMKHSPRMTRAGLTPHDAMIGPMVEVFLHETGHAIVETLEVPFFGREEDVADYIAAYLMLHFCKEDARRLILGASFMSGNEAMEEQRKAPELALLGDMHSLPAVRYFNRWCMAYGYDPVLFADAMSLGMLPQSRAKNCRYEFRTNERAFRELVQPYIDQELKEAIASRRWFEFESPVPAAVLAPVAAPGTPPAAAPSASLR